MYGYLKGLTPGKELDEALKKYKIAVAYRLSIISFLIIS